MAPIVTFEIYSYRNGNWTLDSVHDDKQLAIHQARLLLDGRHHNAIKDMEESYDEATDKSMSKVVFSKKKSDDAPKSTYNKAEDKDKKSKGKAAAKGKKKKKKWAASCVTSSSWCSASAASLWR
jgi:hypothetical protein